MPPTKYQSSLSCGFEEFMDFAFCRHGKLNSVLHGSLFLEINLVALYASCQVFSKLTQWLWRSYHNSEWWRCTDAYRRTPDIGPSKMLRMSISCKSSALYFNFHCSQSSAWSSSMSRTFDMPSITFTLFINLTGQSKERLYPPQPRQTNKVYSYISLFQYAAGN